MPKPATPELGLLISEQHEHGFFHFTGRLVELHGPKSSDIRNPGHTESCAWADDLEIYSQGNDQDYNGRTEDRKLYAWSVRFRPSSVDLPEARRMVKTLEKIERGFTKIDALRGYAPDFGDYVGRVCEILGVHTVLVQAGRNNGWSYGDNEYRRMPLGEGIQTIRYRTNAWIEAGKTPIEPSTV